MASSSTSPWTPEKIRENASSWSLEGDGKLLEFMQSISANLDQRATKTCSSIHHLSLEVDRTKIALENVTNQLAGLQHSQFVENRVYEDDETLANESEVPAGDQEDLKTNYDPIETLTKLLNNSMTVIERNYEKVSIDIDDSDEDDDSPKSIIYRPKDPYEQHPLPYIIGSKEWMEKWHVGICDSDEDFSGEEKEDEYSDSSGSASMSTSLPSNAPTISESECSAWGLQQNSAEVRVKRRGESYGSSEEDLSAATKGSVDKNRFRAQHPSYNLPISSKDSSPANLYYVHQPKQRDAGLFDESSDESTDSELYNVKGNPEKTVPYAAVRGDNIISQIFSDEPPPDVDVVDKQIKPVVDLFCESEDEAIEAAKSPPAVARKEEPTITANKIRKKTVNLFDDDDFDSFMKELTKTQGKAVEVEKPARNLFAESSGEEDALPIKTSEVANKRNDSKEVDAKQNQSVPTKLHAEKPPVIKQSGVSDGEASNRTEDPYKSKPVAAQRKTLFTNLFSDDPPDDDFDSLFSDNSAKKDESHVNEKKSANIFDDFDNDEDPTLAVASTREEIEHGTAKENIGGAVESKTKQLSPAKLKYSNLFGDISDDEADDLFDKLVVVAPSILHAPESFNEETKSSKVIETRSHIASTSTLDNQNTVDKRRAHNLKTNAADIHATSPSNAFSENLNSKTSKIEHNLANSKSTEFPPIKSLNLFGDNHIFGEVSSSSANTEGAINDAANIENGEATPKEDTIKVEVGTSEEMESDDKVTNQNLAKTTSIVETITEIGYLDDSLFFESIPRVKPVDRRKSLQFQSSVAPADDSNTLHKEESHASDVSDLSSENLVFTDQTNYTTLDTNDLFNESPNNPAASSSSKSSQMFSTILFSDVPPNDDEHLIETTASNENDMDAEDFPRRDALNYNPMSLFDDIPPDDNFDAAPHAGKKLHSIFYDDFSETIIPPKMDSKPKTLSSFIFNEPPPDSFQEDSSSTASTDNKQSFQTTTKERVNNESSPKQRLDSEGKIASIIDRMQKGADEPIASVSERTNPPPKKLNTNLNINVSALLPGAKLVRPKMNEGESSTQEANEEAKGAFLQFEDVVDPRPQMIQAESDPNMLPSLNKRRAKIQVKRRPSTRKARQDNYRRSMIEADDEMVGDIDAVGVQEASTKISLVDENEGMNFDPGKRNVTALIGSKLEADASNTSGEAFQATHHTPILSQQEPSGILFEKTPPLDILPPVLVSSEAKSSALFSEEDNDSVADLVTSAPSRHTIAVAEVKHTYRDKSTNQLKRNANKPSIKLFGDDSDDDDLFKNSLKTNDQVESTEKLQQANIISKQSEQTDVKKSIFGSDGEDDDLFGPGIVSEPAPEVVLPARGDTKKLKSSRLFDDEEEDDDDLFGGGGGDSKTKGIISKPTAKKFEPKKPATLPSTSTGKSDFKDPLADLFKN